MNNSNGAILKLGLGVGVIILDQLTKFMFRNSSHMVYNQGISFGLLPSAYWSGIIIILLGVMFHLLTKSKNSYAQLGYILIIFSGISNLIDRFSFGTVRDFIYYPIINITGNFADILIVVGVIILAFIKPIKKI